MNILTAEEMGAADRRTAEEFGVPLESLMESAGERRGGVLSAAVWFGVAGGCALREREQRG